MNHTRRWHPAPFLAAAYLALTLAGEGPTPDWRDIGGSLLLALGTAALMHWLANRIAPDRTSSGMVATLLVLWAGLFGSWRLMAGPQPWLAWGGSTAAIGAWSLLWAILVVGLLRWYRTDSKVPRVVTLMLGILVVMASARMATPMLRNNAMQGVDIPAPSSGSSGLPDIYLIVLDKYSHPRWLAAHHGLDVAPFVDSLRALGFVLPPRPRTNYIHTQLALATLLNSRLVHEELGQAQGEPWSAATALIEDADSWQVFRERGYRLAFFPTGFPGTRHGPNADIVMTPPEPLRRTFGRSWVINTPLDLVRRGWCRVATCETATLFPYPIETAATIGWKLDAVSTLPDSAGPIFAFVHFLGSHEPYQYTANCEPTEPWWPASDVGPDSARISVAYATQISCVNRMLLRLLTELVERSDTPPVIMLQADHGHGRIAIDPVRGITQALADLPADRVAERLDVFAAYRFPGADTTVPDGVTPVNVLLMVRNALFGEGIALQPDLSYWSTYQDALTLTEMPPRASVDTSAGSGAAARAP